ncbi:hypothetical protein RIR_jg26258.t1 [Rhizophagus irregularis DAOM 181602=DAOM 197198]|uniref:Uncharacterized protein n=1 Tax=Rhizophagus irregularis (strain DAOM 197198w) TaxID=1432141 RepID=A0A015LK37_RHIIW|nr:hypothetical protein RirG_063740 [Rhizophagus irregularis DAOM 197198w]GBC51599.2 hypothetical protein RIR_jg26258.t1 [Rhizophagus irregularis DAOM 181602=DAOM 197198]
MSVKAKTVLFLSSLPNVIVPLLPTHLVISSQRNSTSTPNSSGHKPPLVDPNCSQIQEIFSVLKSLQEDMASVRARIHALELADQRMSRLVLCVFGHMQDDVLPPDPNNSSHMLIDDYQRTPLSNTI